MNKHDYPYPPEFPNIGEAAYLAGMTRDDFNQKIRPILQHKNLEFQINGKTRFPRVDVVAAAREYYAGCGRPSTIGDTLCREDANTPTLRCATASGTSA
ncbi:MAG: hypothetical protein OES09_15365, partial [Gammaproteobacteria bacterium]|nr:hypothetical protein [Gammaproteobacteria bacterium]